MTFHDYPIEDCVEMAMPLIEKGAFVYQKFTCEKCGSRQTMSDPNIFYTIGQCEECNHLTDIKKRGCNYMLVL